MPGPSPTRRGWPDFQSPQGVGVGLLDSFVANAVAPGSTAGTRVDVSAFQAIRLHILTSIGSGAITARLIWSYVDASNNVVTVTTESVRINTANLNADDLFVCKGSVLQVVVDAVTGTSLATVLVFGTTQPVQSTSQIQAQLSTIPSQVVAAAAFVAVTPNYVGRGLCTWSVASTSKNWTMALRIPNGAGGLTNFFETSGSGLYLSAGGLIAVPPHEVNMVIINTDAAGQTMSANLMLGTI